MWGLTLMEIVVSLGLTAIICILVIGLLARLLTTSGASSHQTAAALLAHELLEAASTSGPPQWGYPTSDQAQWTGARRLLLPGEASETEFTYSMTATELRNSPDDLGTIHQIEISVWWFSESAETGRAEQGRTTVVTSRTIYVRR